MTQLATIKIVGPGLSVNYPTEIIVKALKEAGLQVEVENEHPCEDPEGLINLIKERMESGTASNCKVTVKTTHLPWGG